MISEHDEKPSAKTEISGALDDNDIEKVTGGGKASPKETFPTEAISLPYQSRNYQRDFKRKSTGFANWRSAHRQSFPVPSIGKNLAIEPKTARTNMDEQCHR
jgi:hypothetical protein